MKEIKKYTLLRAARALYLRLFAAKYHDKTAISRIDDANDCIFNLLNSDKPCMIARFGGNELNTMINAMGVSSNTHSYWKYIKGQAPQWWWNPKGVDLLSNCAGFFPPTDEALRKFGELMLNDTRQLDILGSCWAAESQIQTLLKNVTRIKLVLLEPWHSSRPWSRMLENKRVLVIHPFAESIAAQYRKRELLFQNPLVLPEFKSLRIIKAVQSIGGGHDNFVDWFDALEYMKSEMDKEPYDVAIIGCGAYGFPLAAHAKRTGHKGVHLGGATQLLFGITGNRWIKEYGMGDEYFSLIPPNSYRNLMNEHWIRPSKAETPRTSADVENACYW